MTSKFILFFAICIMLQFMTIKGIKRVVFCLLILSVINCFGDDQNISQVDNTITNNFKVKDITIDTNGINTLFELYLKNRKKSPSEALDYLQQAQVIAGLINNKEKVALMLYHKGYLYRMLGIYNFAIKSYVSSLNYYESVKDKNMVAWLLIDICNLYFIQKEKSISAIEHYKKAEKIFLELGNYKGVILTNNNMALTYNAKKEYNKSLSHLYYAASLAGKAKDAGEDEVLTLSYIGQVHVFKQEFDSAVIYFELMNHLASSKKINEWVAYSFDNYASLYRAQKNPEKAIEYYQKALKIYEETSDKLNISVIYQKISTVYADENNYKKAIEYALKALKIAEENKLVSSSLEILPILAKDYFAINDYNNAYIHLSQYNKLKESDVILNMQQIQASYENDMRYKEEELFKKEQAEKDLEIKRQQFLIYFSLVCLVIFIGLFTLYLIRNKQLKISYQHLFNNSLEIIKKEQELEEIKKREKYSTSLLSEEGNVSLYNDLLELMEQEKIFLNNKLTIEDVAKKLNTNRTYLSQIINEKTDTNFNNFINKYRIKEAQLRLLDDENKSYSIEGIAQTVGFSSKSTFNGAFKKYTGLTPSEYIKMKKS